MRVSQQGYLFVLGWSCVDRGCTVLVPRLDAMLGLTPDISQLMCRVGVGWCICTTLCVCSLAVWE